jgi:hypothetical protein
MRLASAPTRGYKTKYATSPGGYVAAITGDIVLVSGECARARATRAVTHV